MSRIAQAYARAGLTCPGDETKQWEAEREAAAKHLRNVERTTPARAEPNVDVIVPSPQPSNERLRERRRPVPWSPAEVEPVEPRLTPAERIDFELTAAIKRMFLTAPSPIRSLLFCTPAGDRLTDVAWQATVLLAAQSGKRVAFVEDGATLRPSGDSAHRLITRIGWYERSAQSLTSFAQSTLDTPVSDSPVLGERVADLYSSFDFVIMSATAPAAEDLVPLACEVDGVVIVVTANETPTDNARRTADTLRAAAANLIGAVFVVSESGGAPSMFGFQS